MLFESVFYKGASKILLLFKTFLRLNQVNMQGGVILHVVHISGTRIIEAGNYGLSIRNYLVGMMRGVNIFIFTIQITSTGYINDIGTMD